MDTSPIILDEYYTISGTGECDALNFLSNKTYIFSVFNTSEDPRLGRLSLDIYMGSLNHNFRKLTVDNILRYADLLKSKLIELGEDIDFAEEQKTSIIGKILYRYDADTCCCVNNYGYLSKTTVKINYSDCMKYNVEII